jgi:AGZA family xanthine/uracil permease-like MFS transporter
MKPVLKINWTKFDDSIPAFLALILIPFTYSITHGIIWGFLSWTVLKIFMGKWNEINLTLIFIDIFAVLALII